MVRLTTIYWTIGLAVSAAALPFGQWPAMAEEGSAETVEAPPQPIEPKTVRVILLPPADDALFSMRPPASAKAAPAIVQQPADNGVAALLRAPPAKIDEDAAFAAPLTTPKRPPEIALVPPANNSASARPRPEPARIDKPASLVKIPSLPERRPFLPVLYKIEPEAYAQTAAATPREEPSEPVSFMGKVKRSFQPLANLWPGNRREGETASPAAEGSNRTIARSASADAGPASENTDAAKSEPASFLKKLRFWER